jgi:hypothetical protein
VRLRNIERVLTIERDKQRRAEARDAKRVRLDRLFAALELASCARCNVARFKPSNLSETPD